MPRNHKPNPRAVLKVMPDDQQEQLREYCRDHSLAEGVEFCRKTLKVKTNDTSLSEWLQWYDMTQRLSGFNADAEELRELLEADGVGSGLAGLLGERLFMSKAAQEGDMKTFVRMAAVVQRHYELEASKAAHADKMELGREQMKARRKAIAIAMRKLRAAEKRIKALEEKNELMRKAATKAKQILGKGGSMTAQQRADFIKETDSILGLKKRGGAA